MERIIGKTKKDAPSGDIFCLTRPRSYPGSSDGRRRSFGAGPFVFSSPHSGRTYTRRFKKLSQLDTRTLRLSEDCYVDELFSAAPDYGAALISARYPRAYIDVNREPYELDPAMFIDHLPAYANTRSERVVVGLGTIARIVSMGLDIYDRKLTYADEAQRITGIYIPYHQALTGLLEDARASNGWAVLVDCHSMPSCGASVGTGAYRPPATEPRHGGFHDPDIVLGDRFGTSCSAQLTNRIEASLARLGYRVVRNDPYAGGYCTIRYGAPADGIHAIQIEINRRLYMCERSLRKRREDFERIRRDLGRVMAELSGLDLGQERPLAAE